MTRVGHLPKRSSTDSRGFKDLQQARNVTANMARGLDSHYFLVQDHHGLYHFVRIPPTEDGRLSCITTLTYVGCLILEELDLTGKSIPLNVDPRFTRAATSPDKCRSWVK